MTNARDATTIILNSLSPLGHVTVALSNSFQSVLAEDITATENIPQFDNAAMDGYALKIEDLRNIPCVLQIAGEVAAGAEEPTGPGSGQAVTIMTGAKIPAGADAVIQHEWTEMIDSHSVQINRRVEKGHNIRPAGADISRGVTVLHAGQRIRAQEIGVLASLGKEFVEVFRRPRVAILATGNEIVDIGKPLSGSKIRNSNAYALEALAHEVGCETMMLGIAGDDRQELMEKISEGLISDVTVTSGGVSAGKFDLVIEALRELGVDIKFWKVNIKPGMPLVFGTYLGKPVFGLPGNPVSTVVTFLKFVKPALQRIMGDTLAGTDFKLRATLEHEMKKIDGKRHYVRGILQSRNGSLLVRSTGSQISNILTSLVKANCLIILPEEVGFVGAGDEVEVELI